jgi:hypothetical protein
MSSFGLMGSARFIQRARSFALPRCSGVAEPLAAADVWRRPEEIRLK